MLIARETGLPVYLAPLRYDAGLLAEADAQQTANENHPPIIHLLDDGFQHRQLARDVDKNVHRNSWSYIAGAAGVGLLLGYILGRKRK